jgi:dolichyl-diphosphooligosaccharide--protein glycosyltransferase
MTARRGLFFLGIAAALLLGIVLRLSTRDQLTSGGRVLPLSSDSAYHLRRARFAAAHFPRTILFDPLMNFPRGGVPIWPPLFDLALAAPARLLHGADAPAQAVERQAAWVPLLFAAGAIAMAGLLARRLHGPAAGIAAAFFVAVAPGHLMWSQYGHTDQHVAESFFGLLALFLFVASRDTRAGIASPRLEIAAGLALAVATLAWQGAIYWGAIFALSLFLEAIVTRRPVARAAALTLVLPAAIVLAATALWLGDLRVPFTYVSFGFFQPLFLAALAAGTILLETALRATRRQLTRRELARRSMGLVLLTLAALPFAADLATGLTAGIGYVVGLTREAEGAGGYVSYPKDWLKGIFEARPLLADGLALPWRQLSAAFFGTPLAIAAWALRARRGCRSGANIALAVWGSVTLFLALSQRLNVHYAVPLVALTALEAARYVAARGRRALSPAGRPRPAFLAAAAFLLLSLPMLPAIRDEVRTVHVAGSDLLDTLAWMRRSLPRPFEPYDPRFLDAPGALPPGRASAVLAPWSLGHLILYEAERPVVANNFGYGFLDSIRFFLAESEDEALVIARRRRARWVLATDLVPRMNDYAGYLGRKPYLRVTPNGLAPEGSYFSTLQSRLYDFDGKGERLPGLEVSPLLRFRLLHRSQSAIRRGGRWVARWKVFEIVEAPESARGVQGLGP